MAKQLVNPIERHVEKIVVAISAAALLGAAALFLISSPNKLELGGAMVTPTTIDNAVANRAEEIRDRIRRHKPTSVVPEPLADEFVAATQQPPASVYVAAAPILPPVPQIDPPITKVADFTLVRVVTPAKPAVTSGRSTVDLGAETGNTLFRPLDWATVSAIFDRKTQSDLQKHAYGASNGVIYIAPPEIQRRSQRPDGMWSDDDWTTVSLAPTGLPLPLPTLEVEDGANGPMIPLEQRKDLERVLFELTSTVEHRDRLRPLFHTIVNGDPWSFPVLTTYTDVLKQDDELLFPDKPPSESMDDIYELLGGGGEAAAAADLSPAQQAAANMQLAKDTLARAKKERSKYDARSASNLFFEIQQDPAANAGMRNEAKKLLQEAEQLVSQFERAEVTGRGNQAGGQAPGDASDAPARQLLPTQQLWVHDGREGSIQGGKTYQYRMRFRIYNLFAGEAGKFEDPNDATKVLVASDWSPPSDPISFEPWEAYFVTAEDKTKVQAGFEFFRWFYGAWVKSRRHKFGIGDTVKVAQKTTVPSLLTPGKSDSVEVEYSAGATVLDIDFTRAYRERRKGSSPGGVRFAAPRDETAVVLVDAKGQLTERMVRRDKNHPGKKALADKTYKGSR
jgi:hypothetical protein